jgi:capping protein (actin filament) muscle Z-line, beta
MIEDIETRMRMNLDSIYLGKTREIVFTTRMIEGEKSALKIQKDLIGEIFGKSG